jgi:putative addiction module killer protein
VEGSEKQLRIYRLQNGRTPYLEWLQNLKDIRARQKIQVRLARVRLGNFGQTRSVGEGVQELKIDYGPGYRVYFGQDGEEIIILLCGGDKSSQNDDIKEAKEYWANYKREKSHANY